MGRCAQAIDGGADLALAQVLDVELAWVSEIDPAACAVIEARFPGVPNLGDLKAIDWEQLRGGAPPDSPAVDVLTAGYP